MASDSIRGAEEFLKLSKALKAAGHTELRKELNTKLRETGRPLIAKTRAAALGSLPRAGGFAAIVAAEPQRVQVRTGAATAGMRIVVGKRRGGARAANDGTIRHPVFGRGRFVEQQVEPGWFDETLQREAPAVAKKALEEALESVAEKVVKEAR